MTELLGAAHDSINILRNAVAYLEAPPWSGGWSIPEYEKQEWAGRQPRRTCPEFLVDTPCLREVESLHVFST